MPEDEQNSMNVYGQEEEDKKKKIVDPLAPPAAPTSGVSSSQVGVPGASTPQSGSGKAASGTFTDIRKYVAANQAGTKNLAENIGGKFKQNIGDIKSQVESKATDFSSKVASNRQRVTNASAAGADLMDKASVTVDRDNLNIEQANLNKNLGLEQTSHKSLGDKLSANQKLLDANRFGGSDNWDNEIATRKSRISEADNYLKKKKVYLSASDMHRDYGNQQMLSDLGIISRQGNYDWGGTDGYGRTIFRYADDTEREGQNANKEVIGALLAKRTKDIAGLFDKSGLNWDTVSSDIERSRRVHAPGELTAEQAWNYQAEGLRNTKERELGGGIDLRNLGDSLADKYIMNQAMAARGRSDLTELTAAQKLGTIRDDLSGLQNTSQTRMDTIEGRDAQIAELLAGDRGDLNTDRIQDYRNLATGELQFNPGTLDVTGESRRSEALKGQLDQLSEERGRERYLKSAFGGDDQYTGGKSALDSLLLGRSGGQLQNIVSEGRKGASEASTGAKQARLTALYEQAELDKQRGQAKTDLDTNLSGKREELEEAYKTRKLSRTEAARLNALRQLAGEEQADITDYKQQKGLYDYLGNLKK